MTCGDTARRMRVLEVDDARELALCIDARERCQRVDTGIVLDVAPGDTLIVHAGTALAREPA
jgi:hydrogenase maturation factor